MDQMIFQTYIFQHMIAFLFQKSFVLHCSFTRAFPTITVWLRGWSFTANSTSIDRWSMSLIRRTHKTLTERNDEQVNRCLLELEFGRALLSSMTHTPRAISRIIPKWISRLRSLFCEFLFKSYQARDVTGLIGFEQKESTVLNEYNRTQSVLNNTQSPKLSLHPPKAWVNHALGLIRRPVDRGVH